MKPLLVLVLSSAALAAPTCGVERQKVKVMSDTAAAQVLVDSPLETTVTVLRTVRPPTSVPSSMPRQHAEMSVYSVHAWLLGYKLESDQDFHLVISEVGEKSMTMIAEIPSPDCAPQVIVTGATSVRTPRDFRGQFKSERAWVQHQAKPASRGKMVWLPKPLPVHVVGVFFFDHPHGQTGVAPNAAELHPLLSIEEDSWQPLASGWVTITPVVHSWADFLKWTKQ